MRRAFLSMVVAVMLFTLVPAASAGPAARPFKGTVSGTFGVVDDAACPGLIRTVSVATGPLSHLGLSFIEMDHCTPVPPFGPNPGPIVGGSFVAEAANGDSLFGTYEGQPDPLDLVEGAPVSGFAHLRITGGSGRFEGAVGEAHMTFAGTLHLGAPSPMTWILAGAVTY